MIEDGSMKAILFATAVMFPLSLLSCNTMKGIGKDVQSLGRGVTNASEKTSEAIDRGVEKSRNKN